MTTSAQYTRGLIQLLETLEGTQGEALDAVAVQCATSVRAGNLVHLFGSGHSVIPTMDAFPRYGSWAGLHPLTDPRLMWHNVLGPGGVRELLWLERTENYIDKFLDHEPINAGDTLVVYSHSGRNAAGIDAALWAGARGVTTVAVTSLKCRDSMQPAHSSGKFLSDVCDLVVDTGVPVEDAIVAVDGWDRPVGGSSTVVACVVSHEIITRTAQVLGRDGIVLPTFVSPTVAGATLSSNDEVFDRHRRLMSDAEAKATG